MHLGEMFRREVVTVPPEATLREAVRRMKEENVGAVVVVEGRRVVGILTDRDVAMAMTLGDAEASTPVRDVMTTEVVTIWEDEGILIASQYFMNYKVRRLPIVSHDNELVGIVTLDDVIALLGREIHNAAGALTPALTGA